MSVQIDNTLGAGHKPATLIDLLRARALHQPNKLIFTFIENDDKQELRLTYFDLDKRARAIAAMLKQMRAAGQRVLLLYPPGLEYIAGFFGCLYAGAAAVPLYPPRANARLDRLRSVARDARAVLVLTTGEILSRINKVIPDEPQLSAMQWLETGSLERGLEADWQYPDSNSDTLAFIQYTSGSTGEPKGVMLTHSNLLHNSAMLAHGFEYDENSQCVSWLPAYHDMGLIGGVLQPLYGGFPCTLMSPVSFLQRPVRWLQAISSRRATISGAPNFAYDLCARKISPEQKTGLDLSSWTVAFNGSEPIHSETLNRFVAAFEVCGFRRHAFYPCYGLAEATLIVSGSRTGMPPVVKTFQARPLENYRVADAQEGQDDAKLLVGCGRILPTQKIAIVNPESRTRCLPDQVGEIWISSPSVAQGYWNNSALNEEVFSVRLSDTGEGPFLRTGDLGFIKDGEMFITGRLKDLVIIRGVNHYPQDIEYTVGTSHPAIRQGCGAAFSLDVDGNERLVIVQEVDRRHPFDAGEVIGAIREAVSSVHEVQVSCLSLIRPGSVPKTSSGKIRRHACKEGFLAGTLEVIADWKATNPVEVESEEHDSTSVPRSSEEIESWLVSKLAVRLGVPAHEIDPRRPIARYMLDSLMAVEVTYEIEARFGISLPMVTLLQDMTVAQIADEAMNELSTRRAPAPLLRKRGESATAGLTHGQKALWYLYQLAPQSAAYNLAIAARIRAELDASKLRRAFQTLIDRHSSLRTTFTIKESVPIQQIHEQMEVCWVEEDASACDWSTLSSRLVEESHRPFNLEQGPLVRVMALRRSAHEYILLLVIHHIVTDFWSLGIMAHELGTLYKGGNGDMTAPLAPLRFEYADYVSRQEAMLASSESERRWAYWQQQLGGRLPVLNLPTDRPRPRVQTFEGASHYFKVSEELIPQLKYLSQANSATIYMTLLATFQTLLHRLSNQEEILVGSPVTGRNSAEVANLIGYFINPVVLRADFSGNLRFDELLRRVRQTVLGAFAHQDYPFALLVERLQPARDLSRSPVFQAMFMFQQSHLREMAELASFALGESGALLNLQGLELESVSLGQRIAQFDLTLVMAEVGNRLEASFQYSTDLFDAVTIARFAEHFVTLLEATVAASNQPVSDLPLLTKAQQRQMLEEWNDTKTDYPYHLCINDLFEAQVDRTPEAVAVVFDEHEISYDELNRRANQLAHYLTSLGVGPGMRVGICIERSLEMMIGLIGVLKSGAAYVPLDPNYPEERLNLILDEAKMAALITGSQLLGSSIERGIPRVCLDLDWEAIACHNDKNLPTRAIPESVAYTIYTSGSTGKPKGVMISHRSVVNFFSGIDRSVGYGNQDVMLAITSISFDISILELFWSLTRGLKVLLLNEEAVVGTAPHLRRAKRDKDMQFSLFYFANSSSDAIDDKYRLLLEGAKFADRHGFTAIWTPERHFHSFGGLYPNPSVMSAALAVLTERIQLRAGSVVLPLHHPIRVAEEWALVDNLSRGRVSIAFASGWHADDFAFFPENYARRKEIMFDGIEMIRRLWRGESASVRGGGGNEIEVKIFPRPVQPELPIWITAAGTPDTFIKAGEIGANVLTHLLGQTIEEVGKKIALYRASRARHGHDPQTGKVALMLHTFIGDDIEEVREKVRRPFSDYLRTSIDLIANLVKSLNLSLDLNRMSPEDMDALIAFAFDRYFETSALFGTPHSCESMIASLKEIGVDEVACLIDFGVDIDSALSALPRLAALKDTANCRRETGDYSLPAQSLKHQPLLMQCTPSMMRMLTLNDEAMESLKTLKVLMLGGEALLATLAKQVQDRLPCRIINMYGPTETTIWSATHEITQIEKTVPIGRPLANTQVYILDASLQPVPVGVSGELHIGGGGLALGYLNRPELTVEKFIPNPFSHEPGALLYKTGDLATYLPDCRIEFLGRLDQQVKIRGYRIELEEIEAALNQHPAVKEAVILAREDQQGDRRLVAHVVMRKEVQASVKELRQHLRQKLPDYMVPSNFMTVDALPLTPNGKIDRKALLSFEVARSLPSAEWVAPHSQLERIIAEVWKQALSLEKVGIHDNIFDLGGHSLLMAQIHSRLREILKVDLPFIKVLEHPTISSLAKYIGQQQDEDSTLMSNRDRANKQRDVLRRQKQSSRGASGRSSAGPVAIQKTTDGDQSMGDKS
jgi:natural product biosynthesis luciferase-like monooxygenase protein